MPGSRARGRWLVWVVVVVLLAGGAFADDTKPSGGSAAGEISHSPSPSAGTSPESLTPSPTAEMSSAPKEGDPSVPPASSEPPHTDPPPPTSPTPAQPEPATASPAPSAATPVVTPVPTETTAPPSPAPAVTSMESNETKPTSAAPTLTIPIVGVPSMTPTSQPPLPPTSPPASSVSNDTIVATPATTVPKPHDPSTSTQSSGVSYSLAGGASLFLVLVLMVFLIVRRSREAAVKLREERTLAMSEMFLSSSTTHREPSTAQVLRVDTHEEPAAPYLDTAHEFEDESLSHVTILPSPASVGSDPSDSYRSSYPHDDSSSLSGFFDDAPPLSGSSARSSSFFGLGARSELGYDSDMDL